MPEPEVASQVSTLAAPSDPGRDDDRHPSRMADPAEVAGISHQRVSPAFDGLPHFRPETRDRVLAAIEELGHRRRTAARTLVTPGSGPQGAITAHMNHFGRPTSCWSSNPPLAQWNTAHCSRGSRDQRDPVSDGCSSVSRPGGRGGGND